MPRQLPAKPAGDQTAVRDWPGCVPLVALPLLVTIIMHGSPAWVFMWSLAFSIFAGCKWLTWWNARANAERSGWRRTVGYFLSPGMNAATFLDERESAPRPAAREWAAAISKTLAGSILLWGVAPWISSAHPLLTAWIGMFGLILILHFGVLHLVSLGWRKAGFRSEPLMNRPTRAATLERALEPRL